MARRTISVKQLHIDKANATMVGLTALAAVIVSFTIVSSQAFISQALYQNKVIGNRQDAVDQLNRNLESVESLKSAYTGFDNAKESVLKNPNEKNSDVILDALPGRYDFPKLAAGIEAILTAGNFEINSISGTDNVVSAAQSSPNPQPIDIPFQVSITGNYGSLKKLISDFERTIRPIYILTMTISGEEDKDMTMNIDAKTYYQPAKNLEIRTEVIK